MPSNKIIFIVGPTAVGKTAIAFLLAKKLKGEIVSCDSMQIYKEVNIASSKPSKDMTEAIEHYLIDEISVTKEFNVSDFNQKALFAIQKIQKKNKIPVIVGGSGLYMQILLDGIFEKGEGDPELRDKLEKDAEAKGIEHLFEKLEVLDPDKASKIHKNDGRRVIRALEICMTHGKPASQVQAQRQGLWGNADVKVFAINREREELYSRINLRVDEMFDLGLVDEIKKLERKNLSKTAEHIIGVKEVNGYLSGEHDIERAKYLMKRDTRHFAKRQLTWFRKDKRLDWIMVKSNDTSAKIAERIIKLIKES